VAATVGARRAQRGHPLGGERARRALSPRDPFLSALRFRRLRIAALRASGVF